MESVSRAIPPLRGSGQPLRVTRLADEPLARMTAAGHTSAFAVLYERYHQQLYRYCRSIVHDDSDAQDALQSTFARALSALQRGGRDAPLRPWLFRIAHNESISVLRRRRTSDSPVEPDGQVASAEERAGERARFQALVDDLAALPDRPRSALVMRELSGLSHEEIAVALGTSVGAAKQAIFEARKGLAELAEGRAMNCEEVQRKISDGDGRALRGRRVRAHMGACGACAAFAAAIPSRRADLRAIAPPLLPAASAALFWKAMGTAGPGTAGGAAGGIGAGAGAGAGSAAGGIGTGAAGGIGASAAATAGKTLATAVASKVLVGATVIMTAAAGVGGVDAVLHLDHRRTRSGSAPSAVHARHAVSVTRSRSAARSHSGAAASVALPAGARGAAARHAAGSRSAAQLRARGGTRHHPSTAATNAAPHTPGIPPAWGLHGRAKGGSHGAGTQGNGGQATGNGSSHGSVRTDSSTGATPVHAARALGASHSKSAAPGHTVVHGSGRGKVHAHSGVGSVAHVAAVRVAVHPSRGQSAAHGAAANSAGGGSSTTHPAHPNPASTATKK